MSEADTIVFHDTIVFRGGVQVASFEGRDWVPLTDYGALETRLAAETLKRQQAEHERDCILESLARAREWMQHGDTCHIKGGPCLCGLDAFLAERDDG